MTYQTGAKFLADSFDAYGATHVFFVPTILSNTLGELEMRTDIKRILAHSEKSAAYMADGYARASGRVGICMAQNVGAANLAAGLRDAYLACTPMVAFTGGPYPWSRDRHMYQEIEDYPLFKSVTKYSADVDSIDRLPEILRQAFRAATTGTPGPAHIQLEGHMGELEEQEAILEVIREEQFGSVAPFRPVANYDSIKAALDILSKAERPVIVAGGGVRTSGAGAELVALAELLSIPVITSLNAKEVIPNQHPLSAGVSGLYCRQSANRTVLEADIAFFVGSHTGSQVTNNWQIPPVGTPVIQLDIDPAELGRHYPNKVSLCGDAKVTLSCMLEAAKNYQSIDRSKWLSRVVELVAEWYEEFDPLLNSDAEPIRPERICGELTRNLPDDAILVCDTGHSGMWTAGFVDLGHPGQGYVRAAGSLGWGLPGALGVSLGQPDRPVLLFTGDGGIWYHISEIETAVRCNIDIVILVNNNRSLNQEIDVFKAVYGGELHGNHGDLWHFQDLDFAKIAESMGAKGVRISNPSELSAAMEQGFATKGPFIIDVVTDMEIMAPLP
jgi:acetolactate synthase-1/2/3 large subunit